MKGSSFLAFLGGAIIGGVVALLYAPQSGDKTRAQIKDFVEDEVDMAKEFVNRNAAKAKEAVNRGVEQVKEGVSAAKEAVNSEVDKVKASVCEAPATKNK